MKYTLLSVYAAMLGIANIAAVKVVSIGGWEFTAGVIPVAVAYLTTDIAVERYGREFGHRMVWAGVGALLAVVAISQAIVVLPGDSVVDEVLSASLPILAASITAILIGQHFDVALFDAIRRRLPYRPTRNIGSTTVSQLVDTTLFTVLAFAVYPAFLGGATLGVSTMATIIVTEWLIKTGIAVIDTPLFIAATD